MRRELRRERNELFIRLRRNHPSEPFHADRDPMSGHAKLQVRSLTVVRLDEQFLDTVTSDDVVTATADALAEDSVRRVSGRAW